MDCVEFNKLRSRKIGLVSILERINANTYRVEILDHIKNANVFNVKYFLSLWVIMRIKIQSRIFFYLERPDATHPYLHKCSHHYSSYMEIRVGVQLPNQVRLGSIWVLGFRDKRFQSHSGIYKILFGLVLIFTGSVRVRKTHLNYF